MLNRILADVRTEPRLATLVELLALHLDAETENTEKLYEHILISEFGDPKRIKWVGKDDSAYTGDGRPNYRELNVMETVKNTFESVLGSKP